MFYFPRSDSQVKELKKEFMKGKGVPNLVSGQSVLTKSVNGLDK